MRPDAKLLPQYLCNLRHAAHGSKKKELALRVQASWGGGYNDVLSTLPNYIMNSQINPSGAACPVGLASSSEDEAAITIPGPARQI